MKKTVFTVGLCAVLLSMPAILAFPTTNNHSPLFSPHRMSEGTFAGGFGRGHWKNGGFTIDTVSEYMNGIYAGIGFIRISGDITSAKNEKIGEISAFIISTILFGHTSNTQGQQAPIIALITKHQNNQFVGRIVVSTFKTPHIWGYLIPNT